MENPSAARARSWRRARELRRTSPVSAKRMSQVLCIGRITSKKARQPSAAGPMYKRWTVRCLNAQQSLTLQSSLPGCGSWGCDVLYVVGPDVSSSMPEMTSALHPANANDAAKTAAKMEERRILEMLIVFMMFTTVVDFIEMRVVCQQSLTLQSSLPGCGSCGCEVELV